MNVTTGDDPRLIDQAASISWTAADYNLQKSAYTIDEALQVLPFGRTMLNAYIRSGQVEIMKFGRRTAIPAKSLVALLNKHRVPKKSEA